MKPKRTFAPTWVVDYDAARARAIKWLGDRYLLARPINASRYTPRPHPLVLGNNSVHTSAAGLADGEAEIRRIGRRLRAEGRL